MGKKKNSFILWLIVFVLSIAFLIYMTLICYKREQTIYDYLIDVFFMLDIIISLVNIRNTFFLPYINSHRHDYDLKKFIDRDVELKNAITKINNGNKIIFVSGRTGIGKSFFLHKIIDIIYESEEITISSSVYPLYIDLKKGTDVKEAIQSAIQTKDDLDNIDLLKKLHKVTKSKTVIILLDNAEKHLNLEVEEFINTLVSLDDNILFIISAISIMKMNQAIEMGDFTYTEVNEIASMENICISHIDSKTIIEHSGGLPILIHLFIKQLKKTGRLTDITEIKHYIEKICLSLNDNQQDLLSTIAFYSLAENNISEYVLRKYNNNCTKYNLDELSDNGLICYTKKTGLITIQKFFSEIIRSIYEENRFKICNNLYYMLYHREKNDKYKLIFLLLSDSEIISFKNVLDILTNLISEKKYQFLIYLFELLEEFHKLNKYYDIRDVRIKLLYCYIHSLIELGEYPKAYNYINHSETWKKDINLNYINSKLEFDINFDLADMDHFFGNFEFAIDSYMKLKNFTITKSQLLKCNWAIGHCYRHMGDIHSMNIALNCFKEIIEENKKEKNIYYIRAYQSFILIKLYLNDVEYNYDKSFSEMVQYLQKNDNVRVKEILTSRQYAIYHRIILHDKTTALNILNLGLEDLETAGIRIKYDYYFEIAETLRHIYVEQQNPDGMNECIAYYTKSHTFAMRSEDISLKSISQIGIILCRIFTEDYNNDELQIISEICDFCKEKKIAYIFNYAYLVREYLINDIYLHEKEWDSRNSLMNMNLFIM